MWCATCGLEVDGGVVAPCAHCGGEVRLDGRYELHRVLGEGSVGVTYLARLGEDGAWVAIKELSMRRLLSFKKQELFEREAQILKQLSHVGVPDYVEDFIWGVGKHQAFYIVEEFIDGETLREEMSHVRCGEQEVWAWLESALGVLTYLHTRSPVVVHRDLKPENLMRRGEQVVVVDFGVVRDGVGEGTLVGTPGYMAPEQLHGEAYPESDVYALGMVACELLTREDVGGLTRGRWREAVDRVRGSQAMCQVLEKMLAEDYRARWGSVEALEQVAAAARGGVVVVARRAEMVRVGRGDAGGLVVRRRAESLFGMWSALGAVAVMGLPCLTLIVGFLNALIVVCVACLAMILVVPFVSFGEDEVEEG